MIDIQHDSPVPIHEQIIEQLRVHIATGALKPGVSLPEFRAFAQQLVANPQVVARAYADLEWEGVLQRDEEGRAAITPGAALTCRMRLQDGVRRQLRQAVSKGLAVGMSESEIREGLEQAFLAATTPPPRTTPASQAIQATKKPTHETSHRDSQGIQVLPRQKGPGSP
ncbi:MAG: GntR family transcriptional regulator [Gemmataceae bacterium]